MNTSSAKQQLFILQGKWPIPKEVQYLFMSPGGRSWFKRNFGISLPTQVFQYKQEESAVFLEASGLEKMLQQICADISLAQLGRLKEVFKDAIAKSETVNDLERLASFNNWAGELGNALQKDLVTALHSSGEKEQSLIEATRPEWPGSFTTSRKPLSDPKADLLAQYLSFGAAIKGVSENVINSGAARLKADIYKQMGSTGATDTWICDDEGCRPFDGPTPLAEETISQGTHELTGLPASPGRLRGIARVAKALEEAKGIVNGEILVTLMTDVHYEPYMHKASAFITEIGGITAHAAIIAREQRKPCIVSVKGATSIIATGDEIEVDAEKGIVKVLKRQS